MLIAEEFLLLCLDEQTGRRSAGSGKVDPALSAALLAELALLERIGVTGEEEGWNGRRRLTVISPAPTGDAELDRALEAVVANEGRRVNALVSPASGRRLSKGLRDRLLARLVEAGVLRRDDGTILGFVPHTTWPTRDRSAAAEVRERLHRALVDGTTPSASTTALVALLQGAGLATKVLRGADRTVVKARAKGLSGGSWVARAVKQAIDDAGAAGAA